jgi:hypothetical protein
MVDAGDGFAAIETEWRLRAVELNLWENLKAV